jgi:predicted lipoprotein with Yx(FWY)xxD motif
MRILTVAAPIVGLSLLLAACSGGGATTAPTAAPVATTAPASAAASSGAPSASAASVSLADASLGKILVDGSGKTLYVFLADTGGTSVCYDKCEASWPVLHSDGNAPTLGTGLDAGDFATTDRKDGSKQVTFYGQPLYYFAGDTAAGDVKGQGLNDKWYVVGADGKPIK